MHPQDDRPLWNLLGESAPGEAPGRLANDVLRRIRLEEKVTETGFSVWLARSWRTLTGISGVAALLAFSLVFQGSRQGGSGLVHLNAYEGSLLASANNEVPDLGDLDTALDDNDIWLGTELY